MSYNKAKEERKWKKWKQAEEKQLRALGVSEDIILRLRTYDWNVFKEERRYREKLILWNPGVEWKCTDSLQLPVKDVDSFLNSLEDMELFSLLSKEDIITLQILFYKLEGYTSKEICQFLGMSKDATDKRFLRLKNKLSIFLF